MVTVPPLVVLIYTRGGCQLLRSASLPPAVKLHGNQLRKGWATCQVTADCDRVNKEWKPTLLRCLYFMETRREVVGAATTMAEWFRIWTGNYYTFIKYEELFE